MGDKEMKNDFISHYGVSKRDGAKVGSGRYPLGSGERPRAAKRYARGAKDPVATLMKMVKEEIGDADLTPMVSKKDDQVGIAISGLLNQKDFDWEEVNTFNKTHRENVAAFLKEHENAYRDGDEWQDVNKKGDVIRTHESGQVLDRDILDCNHGYSENKPGTTDNCAKCASTLELRLRGYEVNAGRTTYGSTNDSELMWWNGAKKQSFKHANDLEKTCKSFGKSSGTMGIQYVFGGGHAVHWTVDDKGNFEVQDGQGGDLRDRYSSMDDFCKAYGVAQWKGMDIFRLDNCTPNWDAMAQDSVIRLDNKNNRARNKNTGQETKEWVA